MTDQEQATRRARQRRYRERGRQVAVVLRDPVALAALEQLSAIHGGVRAAIEHALRAASDRAVIPPGSG